MSKQDSNKAVVGRWFTEFWGKKVNLAVIEELAAPNMLLKYSLHAPRRGRDDITAFMVGFRAAFPDLNFWGTADLIAEGDYVVGQWEGGGTHTGDAFDDMPVGSLPPATGKTMHFTGTSVLKVENGLLTEEIGLDDGVTVLQQLGLIHATDLDGGFTAWAAAGLPVIAPPATSQEPEAVERHAVRSVTRKMNDARLSALVPGGTNAVAA